MRRETRAALTLALNPVRLALAPVRIARQVTSDLATLADFVREFGPWQAQLLERADSILKIAGELQSVGSDATRNAAQLIEIGEANATVGAEMVELARANLEGNRQMNDAMRSLDERMAELLRFTAVLEQELPALRVGLEHIGALNESASVLSEAAPPLQAAATRVERIASRVPGARGRE